MTNDLIPILMDIADKYFTPSGRHLNNASDGKTSYRRATRVLIRV